MELSSFLKAASDYKFDASIEAKDKNGRVEFTKRWPLEGISSLKVEEYFAVGSKDTFCYWLEFKDILAGAGGGNASKFGIYQTKNGDYCKGRGQNKIVLKGNKLESEFKKLKSQILEAIELARSGKVEQIEQMDCPIWNMVLLKLFTIYCPENYVTALSDKVLRAAGKTLEILTPELLDEYKCIALNYHVNKKLNNLAETKDWSDSKRGTFIWQTFRELTKDKATKRSRKMVLVGFYLSKFGDQHKDQRFPDMSWNEIYDSFYSSLGADREPENFRNSLKASRDAFDAHLTSGRRGWRDEDGNPAKLGADENQILEKYDDHPEQAVWEAIEKYVDTEEQPQAITVTPTQTSAKNIIFYGPPGTGKTYNLIFEALNLIDGDSFQDLPSLERRSAATKRFSDLKKAGQIEMVTFHQSYSYEEFIEGICPITDDNGHIRYEIKDGVFKRFVDQARNTKTKQSINELSDNPTVWRLSLMSKRNPRVFDDCIEQSVVGVDYGAHVDFTENDLEDYFAKNPSADGKSGLNLFINEMQVGDLVCVFNDARSIKAVGVITSDYSFHKDGKPYLHQRKVNWIDQKVIDIFKINGSKKMMTPAIHRLNSIKPTTLLDAVGSTKQPTGEQKSYVFIIDEINRGNISKVFGELITLIEEDKREGQGGISLKLPYSSEDFIIPDNVYILGTMNTADRSISMIDVALRRRFTFEEVEPQPSLVKEEIEGISLRKLYTDLNRKIALLQGRDYRIGHSYLISAKVNNIETLRHAWFFKILPLINEYCYEEWDKIRALVGPFVEVEARVKGLDRLNLIDNRTYKFKTNSITDEEFIELMKLLETSTNHLAEDHEIESEVA